MLITRRSTWIVVSYTVAALLAPAHGFARDFSPRGWAATTGLSSNPDQFTAGVQFQLGSSWTPQLRPTVDLGVGNGVRLVSFGGDVLYHFSGTRWRPYAGGGPGLNLIDVTNGVGETDGLQAKLVAHAVAGLSWIPRTRSAHRYFIEGRLGVGDTPDVRLAFGMAF